MKQEVNTKVHSLWLWVALGKFHVAEYIAGPLRSALKDVLSTMEKNSFNLQLGFYHRNEPCIIEISGDVGGMEEVTDMQWVCSGTGREVAIGVMAALWDSDIEVQSLLEKAIEVASKYNAYTALPSEYLALTGRLVPLTITK